MKILVVVPLNPREPQLYAATYESIVRLQFDGKLDVLWMRHDASDGHYDDLADKLNRARDIAILGGYDAMLVIEYDMIIPADAIYKLLSVDADVVYGLYCSRVTKNHTWLFITNFDDYAVTWPTDEERRAAFGRVVTSSGVGTGCTLLRPNALQDIIFRTAATNAPDWQLAMDAQALKLRQAHHMGVVCGHIMDDRHVLWPDPTQPELFRIDESSQLFVLAADRQYRVRPGHALVNDYLQRTFRDGDIIELDPNQAALLTRKGIVECV